MKSAYERRLYREGYRMPETCLGDQPASDEASWDYSQVQTARKPFGARILHVWIILQPGRSWLVSPIGYLTVEGAIKAGRRTLARMEQIGEATF